MNQRRLLWLVLATLLTPLHASYGANAPAPIVPQPSSALQAIDWPKAAPTSLEYKLLLSPTAFPSLSLKDGHLEDPKSVTAYLAKIKLGGLDADKLKLRTIQFYDTKACDFLENHLLLRKRTGKNDITLKCRTDSALSAVTVGQIAGSGAKENPELGEERIFESATQIASRFSMDTKLETMDAVPGTLATATSLFPGLRAVAKILGLEPQTKILAMNQEIAEVELSTNSLEDLGISKKEASGEVDLTFWFRAAAPKELLIAELSFKIKSALSPALRQKADKAFQTLRANSMPDPRTSKTAVAYGNSCGGPVQD